MERKANSSPFAFLGNAVGAKRRRASAVGAKGTVCPQKDAARPCACEGCFADCLSFIGMVCDDVRNIAF